MTDATPDLLGGDDAADRSPTMVDLPPPPSVNGNASAPSSSSGNSTSGSAFSSFSLLASNLSASVSTLNANVAAAAAATPALSSDNALSLATRSIARSVSHGIAGRNTLPDKTTASQVLMFRQLLHTKCRPGLRLSRKYEATAAQRAVLHMPWWERGIEQSRKMIISYDNLITRLWLSGAIMPFERGGYATTTTGGTDDATTAVATAAGAIDTLINEKGLPPVPHQYWVDRLGFQQDDPVTDFRSGGVLSLAMLVHIVESCPSVHSRFVPKPKADIIPATTTPPNNNPKNNGIISLEEIIADDASVLPFGITCINITDMLAKFLLFSKAIDKMDALLSAKPFWKMFIDPNAMLVLQEVSLDLLCDVCVEIGRERRIKKLAGIMGGKEGEEQMAEVSSGMPGSQDGKVTVFDFSEIMERTEKRVGDEVLGPGPRSVDELRAIARRVKSKYLMRIQLKEKHLLASYNSSTSPLDKQLPPMPSKESMKNMTNSVIGAAGGFVSMLKKKQRQEDDGDGRGDTNNEKDAPPTPGGQEVEVNLDGMTSSAGDDPLVFPKPHADPFASAASPDATAGADDELEKLSAELGDLSAATAEAFDLLGDDFDGDVGHPEELLDAMDEKVDPFAAFAIDEDEFLS